MRIVPQVVADALEKWSTEVNESRKKFESFTKRVVKPEVVYQVHAIPDTDKKYMAFVDYLIATFPTYDKAHDPTEALDSECQTLPSSQKVSSLGTLMSEPPNPPGYPPPGLKEVPLSKGAEERIHRRCAEIFTDNAFIGCTMKREASLNFPAFQRTFDARQKAFFRGLGRNEKVLKQYFNWDFSKFSSQASLHLEAIQKQVFAILFAVVVRKQPAPLGKEYRTWLHDGSEVMADRSTAWSNRMAYRRRLPVGGPGYENLSNSGLNAGLRKSAELNFPYIFKHKGPNHIAHKINQFAAGKKVFFVAVDLSQMEYSMHSTYVKAYHERFDQFFDKVGLGYSRHLYVNAPTASPNYELPPDKRSNSFLITHDFEYDYKSGLTLGNRSGSFIVTDSNKLAGSDCMLEALSAALNTKFELIDVEAGDRVRLMNLGDDNLFVFKEKSDASRLVKFLSNDPVVCGFTLGIEPTPSFLKYHVIYRNGRYEMIKDAFTFISNLVTSEYGVDATPEEIANLGAEDQVDPGIGYFARLLDYASNSICIDELRPWFEKALKQFLDLTPTEAYPTSVAEIRRLVNAESKQDDVSRVNAMEIMLRENPDYIYYRYDSEDIPQELLDRMFLHITIEQMKEAVPGLPMLYSNSDDIPKPVHDFEKYDEEARFRVLVLLEKSYLPLAD